MTILRIKIFLKSLFFHIYRGFPKSTIKEIKERYAICLGCDKFDTDKSECIVCGCNINQKRIFLNKLAWADQECPIGKWSQIKRQ